jgi:hypothetical protein
MQSRFSAILVVALIATFVIMGCEGKKGATGPQGPEGPSGTTDCVQCHSDDTRIVARQIQWENSVHFTGGNFTRNTPPCSGCHTTEGFVAQLATPGNPGTIANPSPIGCFACHAPHTNLNFDLRTQTAVTLMMGGTFDRGEGNLCANCHQARVPSPPVPSADTTLIITSSHWGIHDGPQANILSGNGAYQFGGTGYGNSYHTTGVTNGCPACHMATPTYGAQAGGHTMSLTYGSGPTEFTTGCKVTGCHATMPDFNKDGVQDSTEALLMTLENALIARGILDADGGIIAPDTLTTLEAKALVNYELFETDRSLGVHNTEYTFDALNATIAALVGQ